MGMKGKSNNSRRKYPGVGGRRNNPVGLLVRREEAAKRDEAAKNRTPSEQLARLDARQCEAKRERARLLAKLRSAPTTPAPAEKKPAKAKVKAKDRREQKPKEYITIGK